MKNINYLKAKKVTLDEKSNYNVSWIEAVLIDNPNTLGINDLEFMKKYKCEETSNNSTLLFDWSRGSPYESPTGHLQSNYYKSSKMILVFPFIIGVTND